MYEANRAKVSDLLGHILFRNEWNIFRVELMNIACLEVEESAWWPPWHPPWLCSNKPRRKPWSSHPVPALVTSSIVHRVLHLFSKKGAPRSLRSHVGVGTFSQLKFWLRGGHLLIFFVKWLCMMFFFCSWSVTKPLCLRRRMWFFRLRALTRFMALQGGTWRMLPLRSWLRRNLLPKQDDLSRAILIKYTRLETIELIATVDDGRWDSGMP
jgi:hypothetical protein